MPKVTAQGKTFNFPEGTTTDQMGQAIDEYFSGQQAQPAPEQAPQQAPQQPQAEQYQPNIQPQIKAPANLPYGMKQSDIDAANKRIAARNQYEQSFVGDLERQQMRKEEQERGVLDTIGQGALHTAKEMYAGTLQSPDWLPAPIQKLMDYRIGGDNDLSREEVGNQLEQQMAEHNKRYDITRGEHPIATTVGETLPYLATGAAGEKALLNIGENIAPKLLNARIGVNELMGNTAKAGYLKNRPRIAPSEFRLRAGAAARGTATGAGEGAAQYDSSALEGGAAAGIGALSGMVGPLRVLNKMHNERDAAGRALVSKMEGEGFKITPGMRTGNRAVQTEEAGFRNSDAYGQDFYNTVDRPNERKMTEMAGEAIGMDTRGKDLLSQDELAGHMQNLSNEYKTLEADTVGKFSQRSYAKINSVLKNMQPTQMRNNSATARQNYSTMKDILAEMRTVLQPFKTQEGKFAVQKFDGSKYQAASQFLNDHISKAYHDGDKAMANKIKMVKGELDKAIESGMGKTTSKEWRDLNERYAMSRMLLESGLTPSGMVDPLKLTSAVMGKDEAVRTMTGKGNRIKKFQDIARYNDILSHQEGGSLTGLGQGEPNVKRGIARRGMDFLLPGAQKAKLAYRLSDLPTVGISPTASVMAGRAIGASEPGGNVVQAGKSAYESLMDRLGVK